MATPLKQLVHISFLLFALAATGCVTKKLKVESLPSATRPYESPVVVALTHFRDMGSHEMIVSKSTPSKGVLLLARDYQEDKHLIYAGHFRLALDGYFSVPEDLRLDLERRTGEEKWVPASDVPSCARLVDFVNSPRLKEKHEFAQVYPDALSAVFLWPTGLSRDGNRALVVFHYGVPWPGWRAAYLLERRDSRWKIVHYAFPGSD